MAHKHKLVFVKTFKKLELRVDFYAGSAILACGAGFNLSAEGIGHKLGAVADSEHRNSEIKNLRVAAQGFVRINAVGSAGKNYADGGNFFDFFKGNVAGLDFGINPKLAHAARDKLAVLSAEIENNYGLVFHFFLRCAKKRNIIT